MTEETTSNVYIIHRVLAVLLDVAVVALFVFVGGKDHDASYVFGDYVRIGLPFLAAFFGVQLAMGKDQRNIKYAAIAGAIAVPIGMSLRALQPEYDFKIVFLIIAFLFMNAGWILWRVLLNKLRPAK